MLVMKNSILLIEDNLKTVSLLEHELHQLGYHSEIANDGVEGLEKALTLGFDLIILDWMLPKMQGPEVCRAIREQDKHTPIMMLTVRANDADKVIGLELGADDYLQKPFSLAEFHARVRALLRRSSLTSAANTENSLPPLRYNGLMIDFDKRYVTLDGTEVSLSFTEFELLKYLAQRAGIPCSRALIGRDIFKHSQNGYDDNINTHMNRLRKKLETDPRNPQYIHTLRGMGYRFGKSQGE